MTHTVPGSASDDSAGLNPEAGSETVKVTDTVLWDRKADGGFPETKELKNRVRNIIDPQRDLGHIDRSLQRNKYEGSEQQPAESQPKPDPPVQPTEQSSKKEGTQECEDCK